MRILRVFPQRNSYTPRDAFAVVGFPPLPGFYPNGVDEVHISCTFTWDIAKCQELAMAWAEFYPVTLGGPAFNSPCGSFKAGFYVRPGITFTSRGCNNQCPWCFVPEREGKFYPFRDFEPGHIVQDNNLLQADRSHLRQVFAMLRAQKKAVSFSGGLQSSLVKDWVVEEMQSLSIAQIFLAADTKAALQPLEKALQKLRFLDRQKLRVFALLAYDGESISEATERLETIWAMGGMPFAQLYQPKGGKIEYSTEWRRLARKWSRPAAMKSLHKPQSGVTSDCSRPLTSPPKLKGFE
jgi:hypothetical protein